MTHQGLKESKNDYSLLIRRKEELISIAAIYVDNILLTSDFVSQINDVKHLLDKVFSIKALGLLHFFPWN